MDYDTIEWIINKAKANTHYHPDAWTREFLDNMSELLEMWMHSSEEPILTEKQITQLERIRRECVC